jgi:hypothetical protein
LAAALRSRNAGVDARDAVDDHCAVMGVGRAKSIDVQVASLFRKFGVASRYELVLAATSMRGGS